MEILSKSFDLGYEISIVILNEYVATNLYLFFGIHSFNNLNRVTSKRFRLHVSNDIIFNANMDFFVFSILINIKDSFFDTLNEDISWFYKTFASVQYFLYLIPISASFYGYYLAFLYYLKSSY